MTPDGMHRQLTLDIEEEVFRHLMFHKSMIDDSDDDMYEKLDRYLGVLSDMKEGIHVTIKDSYSRSIAMVLELATEEYLDPWDVDLVRFCRMFIEKLKERERINLVVIGKLIRMAYTVHMLKSENTLRKAEIGEEDELIDDDRFFDWMEDDETFEVTRGILQEEKPPIVESIVHKGDRPVTLVDLLNALEDVEEEVELIKDRRQRRAESRKRIDSLNRENIDRKVFKENTEEDIKITWQRINKFNGHPISLSTIENDFELDTSSTLISLLFLARDDMIRIWQRSFPRGEIMLRNISTEEKRLKYGELEENADKVERGETEMDPSREMIVEKKEIPSNFNT